jgi:hypothetical protein
MVRETRFLLKDTRRKLRCMQLHHMPLQRHMERRVRKSVRIFSGQRLYVKGQFTKEARRLIRTLVNLGCPLRSVGDIIRSRIEATGATIDALPSARTVWRALIEGGLASKAQIIAELRRARGKLLANLAYNQECTYEYLYLGFVVSGDGTSNKHINYESHCLYYHASDAKSTSPDSVPVAENIAMRKQHVLGVYSTPSHSSKAQVQNLLEVTNGMRQTYNSLPSFKSSGPATNDELFRKVTGVISDHAEHQKKKSSSSSRRHYGQQSWALMHLANCQRMKWPTSWQMSFVEVTMLLEVMRLG